MQWAIKVENLSKQYQVGPRLQGNRTLREAVGSALGLATLVPASRRRRVAPLSSGARWALKDLSFQIQRGESVGIIGRNGAGKSTLLRILSRITRPTSGRARVRGRLVSLIEVGTGFHPDLSGRENIFLNGSLMGMKQTEIRRKFDEIVAFSEVEKALDTAVKYYSSGMYMRLAFAVAAHLEPEILVLDEILSVGDAPFQKKCLNKVQEVVEEGCTVLFVSHSHASVASLCKRAIWLDEGCLKDDGPAPDVIEKYLAQFEDEVEPTDDSDTTEEIEALLTDETAGDAENEDDGATVKLHDVRLLSGGTTATTIDILDDLDIEIEYWNYKPDNQISVGIYLINEHGVGVVAAANQLEDGLTLDHVALQPQAPGLYRTVCRVPGNLLNHSLYQVNVYIETGRANLEVVRTEAASFRVCEDSVPAPLRGRRVGAVRPPFAWQTECLQETDVTAS